MMPKLSSRASSAASCSRPGRSIGVSFRAGEGVQLGGWDGLVSVEAGNAFVPDGVSGWELGTNRDVRGKADEDYEKRTGDPGDLDPSRSAYVFVTPRRWRGKERWASARSGEGVCARSAPTTPTTSKPGSNCPRRPRLALHRAGEAPRGRRGRRDPLGRLVGGDAADDQPGTRAGGPRGMRRAHPRLASRAVAFAPGDPGRFPRRGPRGLLGRPRQLPPEAARGLRGPRRGRGR